MKPTDIPLLTRIFGTVDALFWLPLLQSLGAGAGLAGWQSCYLSRGLGFAMDRAGAESCRRMVADGLLATSGATQGKAHGLSAVGVLTAMHALGLDAGLCRDWLFWILEAEEKTAVTFPRSDRRVLMCWEFLDSAGVWLTTANATDQSWAAYQSDLITLSARLCPLLILGCVTFHVDGGGRLWGVTSTPAGRAAAEQWPDAPPIPGGNTDELWEHYHAGYSAGVEYARRPPPPDFRNVVARILPASGWMDLTRQSVGENKQATPARKRVRA